MRVALVGAGNVGTAVAYLLARNDHEIVAIASRSLDSALRASRRLNADVYRIEDLPEADLVLVGVSDPAIEAVAEAIAPRIKDGSFVCHFAGAFGPSVLRPVLDQGASACAIHPVQSCPSIEDGIEQLPDSAWGVTCSDPGSEERMIGLIEQDLAGFPVVLPEAVRPLWHAAAAMTSNGIAALMAAGEGLLGDIGVEHPARVLGPLAAGTVENAREGGGGSATLTGPVVRGEKQTVRRHLTALAELTSAHEALSHLVASLIVRVALDAGRIDSATADDLIEEFGL